MAQERLAEYKAGGFNVGADWCEVKPPLFANINYNYTAVFFLIIIIFFFYIFVEIMSLCRCFPWVLREFES